MKLNREQFIRDKENLIYWLVISGLAEAMKNAPLNIKFENAKEIDIQMLVDGQEIDVEILCQKWQAQVKRMIEEKAVELLSTRLKKIADVIYDIEQEVMVKARDALGLEDED